MQTAITIFRIGQAPESAEVDLPERPPFHTIRAAVLDFLDGADPERVNVFHEGRYTDMFVDEDGIKKGLPVNEAATAIYRNNTLTHVPGTDPESLPFVYGPAVLMSRRVWW